MKRIKLIFAGILYSVCLLAQNNSNELYNRFENALLLGLENEALSIGLDLITNPIFENVREESLYNLAGYFLKKHSKNGNEDDLLRAMELYNKYLLDYPQGKHTEDIQKIISFTADLSISLTTRNLINAKSIIVERIFKNSEIFLKINNLNPLSFFWLSDFNQTAIYIANKYYNEIIVNFPEFEVYAYQKKIYTELSFLTDLNFLSSDVMEIKKIVYKEYVDPANYALHKTRADAILQRISEKFPNHRVTLDMHLVFARLFMIKTKKKIDKKTLEHLQFVLENDQNKLGLRYFLTKEFVSNNKFEGMD